MTENTTNYFLIDQLKQTKLCEHESILNFLEKVTMFYETIFINPTERMYLHDFLHFFAEL